MGQESSTPTPAADSVPELKVPPPSNTAAHPACTACSEPTPEEDQQARARAAQGQAGKVCSHNLPSPCFSDVLSLPDAVRLYALWLPVEPPRAWSRLVGILAHDGSLLPRATNHQAAAADERLHVDFCNSLPLRILW